MFGMTRTRALDPATTNIDNDCYHQFGDAWWSPDGPVSGLHEMNPARVAYFDAVFREQFGDGFKHDRRFIDVGCGGGILSEALARSGYKITGYDVSEPSLAVARRHAAIAGVRVRYESGSAYSLPIPDASVDGVITSDVLEHLHDLPRAAAELARVLKPGGVLVFDTISRTPKSYLLMIVLAQNVLRLVHPKTHDFAMFIRPNEMRRVLAEHRIEVREMKGLSPARPIAVVIWNVWRRRAVGPFTVSKDLAVSYLGYAVKQESV
jgi:2-polyprenyl-6-hydroxyphenyl methylase/3-demethylubiquinone-9 3-methyltransferase